MNNKKELRLATIGLLLFITTSNKMWITYFVMAQIVRKSNQIVQSEKIAHVARCILYQYLEAIYVGLY